MSIEQKFYLVKTGICFAGYAASVAMGEPSGVLASVTILSALAFAALLYFQGIEE
jgi:hypothetical protein